MWSALALALAPSLAAVSAEPSQSAAPSRSGELRTAVFAGGCFWCMEGAFDGRPGVVETLSGYTGGTVREPTYEQVTSGRTGHTEALQVVYDPKQISYAQLVEIFWRNIDPLDAGGQFCDRGSQYRSAAFYASDEERAILESSKRALEAKVGRPFVTEITAAAPFYRAEDYHQDYYLKNPVRYRYYRFACGRDARLEAVWGAAARGDTLPPKATKKGGAS
jgi:peptide-methionine (S)-S-oxide reductase